MAALSENGNYKGGQQHGPSDTKIFYEQCINALKGPTDEHRFVGLLLLAKILPKLKKNQNIFHNVDGNSNVPIRQHIFDAIGPIFLRRLFIANDASLDKDRDNRKDYRDLALLVLSFLLEEENVAKVFIDFSPKLFLNLHNNKSSRRETLKCIVSLCRVNPKVVTKHIIDSGTIGESNVDSTDTTCNHLHLLCENTLLNQKYENDLTIRCSAMYLLYHLISCHRIDILLNKRHFNQYVTTLSHIFANVTKDKTVFDAVKCLAILLNITTTGSASGDAGKDNEIEALIKRVKGEATNMDRTWQCNIFKGALNMLKSKIPLDTRSKLFQILHFMLLHEEEHWGLGNDLLISKERTTEEAQKLKDLFPMLLAKSTMIEARVNVDIVARTVIDGDIDTDTEGQEHLVVLECCYGIVERCVQFLVSDEETGDKWNMLKPATLLSLRDSFIDVVQTGVSLLDYFNKVLVETLKQNKSLSGTNQLRLLEIIFRLLSTWLSVDAVSIAERLLNSVSAIESIFLTMDPKNPQQCVVMEYSLPTLTILVEDYNAIIEINNCKKMFKKLYELDFETKRRYEADDEQKNGMDQTIFIKRLLEHFRH